MASPFEFLIGLLQRQRGWVLGLWLISLLSAGLCLWLNPAENLETELTGARGTEAWQVREILTHDFGRRLGSSAALVMPAGLESESLRRQLLKRFPEIASINQVNTEVSHRLQLLSLEFKQQYPLTQTQDLSAEIRAELKRWSEQRGLQAPLLTGNTAFQYDAKIESKKDSRQSEGIALLLSLVVLVLNFGSLSAAVLPLMMGASSLVMLNALIKLTGWSVNPVSRILTSLVGLALGIDYALFIVSRFREELAKSNQPDISAALKTSLNQAGRTILYSGLIMLCSLSALLLPDVTLSRTVMFYLLLVIVFSLLHALLILPALLSLGPRWLSWPGWLARRLQQADNYQRWKAFSTHVVDHARRYFVLAMLLLGAMAWPLSQMRLWDPVQAVAPKGSESRLGYTRLMEDNWGGELLPVILVVQNPRGTVYDEGFIAYLYSLNQALSAQPAVQRVQSLVSSGQALADYQALYRSLQSLGFLGADQALQALVNVASGSQQTLVYVYPKRPMEQVDSRQILDFAKTYALQHPEYPILRGGIVARVQDFTFELYRYTPWMLLLILVGVYLLLWWHMKTLILPLKAAVMNFVPILAAFGVLTLIFQYGWFSVLLHTPVNGAVTNTVPIVLFCIVFGLSMDYEVLILSRVSEEYRRHGNVRQAVIEGLARSGSVITGAVLILLGVFLPGCFSSSPQTQEICIGITLAILLDATIVRLLLVPSFMMLLGRWNWWQPISDKQSPKI